VTLIMPPGLVLLSVSASYSRIRKRVPSSQPLTSVE